jgi:hypothetical protein
MVDEQLAAKGLRQVSVEVGVAGRDQGSIGGQLGEEF